MFDALDQIQQQTKKTLFMSQTRTIVIGEQLARRGVHDPVDFLWRTGNKNLTSWILVSKIPAKDLLRKAKELESVPADAWKLYFLNKNSHPSSEPMELFHFLPSLDQEGLQATGAGIMPAQDGTVMKISETAVFRHDKMVGWLTEEETGLLKWIKKEIGPRTLTMNMDYGKHPVSMSLSHFHSRIVSGTQGGKITMNIRLRAEAEVAVAPIDMDFTNLPAVKKLETRLNERIKTSTEQMLNKICSKYQSDIIGFGKIIHRKDPQRWKKIKNNWNERLPEIKVTLDAHTHIVSSGIERVSRSERK